MASDVNDSLVGRLSKLNAFVERSSEVVFDALRPYSVCVKFAFGRAFSFATLAAGQDPATAFFIVPALRAVTEDLILFRFLDKTGTPDERDMVIRNLMLVDVHEKLDHQSRFFDRFRPFQPVLSPPADSAQQIEDAKDELADYWRDHGWQGFAGNKAMPPIRELAEKSDPGLLEVVYDFVYRLASGEVHSTPRTLLRLGWGTSAKPGDTPMEAKFSTKNLARHHLEVAQIYSAYIVCLWFELFEDRLDTTEDEVAAVAGLRECLLSRGRWPEMVTHEEMNLSLPDAGTGRWPNMLITALYRAISSEGFVAGMDTILNSAQTGEGERASAAARRLGGGTGGDREGQDSVSPRQPGTSHANDVAANDAPGDEGRDGSNA